MKCIICDLVEVHRNAKYCEHCRELIWGLRAQLGRNLSGLLTEAVQDLAKKVIIEKNKLLEKIKKDSE